MEKSEEHGVLLISSDTVQDERARKRPYTPPLLLLIETEEIGSGNIHKLNESTGGTGTGFFHS